MKLLLRIAVNALGIYLTTGLIPALSMRAFDGSAELLPLVLTFLLFGFVFMVINAILVPIIKVVAFPLYLLTLGLIGLVVNALMFFLVLWGSEMLGWGLFLNESFLWSGVLAALLLALINAVLSFLLRRVTK